MEVTVNPNKFAIGNAGKKFASSVSGNIFRVGATTFDWDEYWLSRFVSGLTITINSDTQITLDWLNNGLIDYDDIRIERTSVPGGITGWSEIDSIPIGSQVFANCSLTPGIWYYRLRYAKDYSLSPYSSVVQVAEADFYPAMGCIVSETNELFIDESLYFYYIIKQ